MNKPDNIIFESTDPFGRKIILDSSTWNEHIIPGHDEMKGNEISVKNTIENPDFIYESNTHNNRDVFFSVRPESTYPKLYTKVVVEINKVQSGEVSTAFFSKEVQGVKGAGLKYVKSNI